MTLRVGLILREMIPDLSWVKRGHDWKTEVVAGLIGAILVVPQGITFAYLAGLSPQNGIYCSIFVTLVCSLFGRSALIGGPNTSVAMLLGLTVLPLAGRGSPLYVDYAMILTLMVGLIQLLFWLLRFGALFRFLIPAVTQAISTGVGCLIILSSIDGIMGLSPIETTFFYEKLWIIARDFGDLVNPYALAIGLATCVSGLFLKRLVPRWYIIGAMGVGTIVGAVTMGLVPAPESELELLGYLSIDPLPFRMPPFTFEYWSRALEMLGGAVAIAFLGQSQSMVIATDLKATIPGRIDLNKEMFAQGIANAVGAFFQSFAGSGSFNRTQLNIQLGARTPLAGIIAAVGVAVIVALFGRALAHVPMAVVSGVLMLVGIGTISVPRIRTSISGRFRRLPFLLTLFSVLFLGLDLGIWVGMACSLALFVAGSAQLGWTQSGERVVEVRGNLYHAAAQDLVLEMSKAREGQWTLNLTRVGTFDVDGIRLLARFLEGSSIFTATGVSPEMRKLWPEPDSGLE